MVVFSSDSFCFSFVDAESSWTCSMWMEIIMGMYNKFINLKKVSNVQLCLEHSSWIVFIFPVLTKFLYFSFPSQTFSLRTYLLSLSNGVCKQNAFQLKLAMMTWRFLNQNACPRDSGGKGSPESFKCNWSSRTILYNVSPKEQFSSVSLSLTF